MTAAALQSIVDLRRAPTAEKASREWQEALWQHWTTPEQWPGSLDVFEAAAYKRVSHATIRAALGTGRDGKAKLRHQRFGASYRIAKADLDRFGLVQDRAA